MIVKRSERGADRAWTVLGWLSALLTVVGTARAAPPPAPDIVSLEQRATQLQDIADIERLQRAYGYYLDRSDWDNVVDLLTDDATLEYGNAGVYVGKAHARALLYAIGYGKAGLLPQQLREHTQLQPVITLGLDGRTAKGRWNALVLLGQYQQYARWQTGPYENEYRKEHGVWKISRIHWYETFTVPFVGGWKTAMSQTNVADRKLPPPDRPPSFEYQPWPAVSLPPYHWSGPGDVAPLRPAPVSALNATPAPAELAQRLAVVRRQVERLEDRRQVEILQRTYGYYVDRNLWTQIAGLFTEDGTLEIGGRGVFRGRARVLQYLRFLGDPQAGRLYEHTQLQPIVDVSPDGTRAKGRWRALIFTGGMASSDGLGGSSVLGDAIYENEYRKQGGKWKISKLHAYFIFYSALEKGWGVYAMPNTRPEKALPPDEPPSLVYDMYPGTLVAPLHYENPVTGKPVYSGAPAPAPVDADPGKSAAQLAGLNARLTRLEDARAIENVQNAYGYYLEKWQWDAVAALFADDGTLELGGRGVYVGPSRIRASLQDAFGPAGIRQGEVNNHYFYQPVIHVAADGRTARVRVRALTLKGRFGHEARIGEGVQENEYVKQGGEWKIKSLHYYPSFEVDYDKGWSHGALPSAGPSTTLPPDHPPSAAWQPYPAFQVVPFHYPNPVTGKPVEVPPVLPAPKQ